MPAVILHNAVSNNNQNNNVHLCGWGMVRGWRELGNAYIQKFILVNSADSHARLV